MILYLKITKVLSSSFFYLLFNILINVVHCMICITERGFWIDRQILCQFK